MLDLLPLMHECAPQVHSNTMMSIVRVESSGNPFAIGVVGGELLRQPRTAEEAVATAESLDRAGYNFSVGLSQVNKFNFAKYGLTLETAFQPCRNLAAGSQILAECFGRAKLKQPDDQAALRDSFSCYYAGNFTSGYRLGYVAKVVHAAGRSQAAAEGSAAPIPVRRVAGQKAPAKSARRVVEPVAAQAAPGQPPSALLF